MNDILISGGKHAYLKKIFLKFFIANIFGWIIYISGGFVDSIFSGRLFGEEALAAVGVLSPIMTILFFVSCLSGRGMNVIHAKLIAENKFKEADKAFGEAVIFNVLMGLIMSLGLFIFKESILGIFGMSEAVYAYASDYYNPLIVYAFILPITEIFYYSLASDGAFGIITLGNSGNTVFNILFSLLLANKFGIAGLSMATCVGSVFNALLFSIHFFMKSNTFKFKFAFNFKEIAKFMKVGIGTSSTTLFTAVVDFVLNIYICKTIGSVYVAPYNLINFATQIACAVEMAGESLSLLCAFGLGEKNNIDIKAAIKISRVENIFICLGFSILFTSLYAVWPNLYGITSPELVRCARSVALIIGPIYIFYGLIYLHNNFFTSLEKADVPFISNLLNLFIVPLVLSLILGSTSLGFMGIVISFSICTPISYLLTLIYIKIKYHDIFPLPKTNENQYTFDYLLDDESIVKLRDKVITILNDNAIDKSLINKVALTIEELMVASKEQNNRKVNGRLFIDITNEEIRIIDKNDGKINDLTNEDSIVKSLNTYVLNQMLTTTSMKTNYASLATNAHSITFKL